jgi:propionyl-CoA carboxylase alpha chain
MTKPLFEKVLVANRGEIALRIFRTLKKMGIKSVAVYSEADTNSLHVQHADEAVYIGPSPATESYLSIPNIINALRTTGANALHPGYGFLSENAEFAKALKKEGVTLIGPSAKIIGMMGDKIEAKKIASDAGVSTIPGFVGAVESVDQAITIAQEIGFPVMLKAAAGGGGKGMRVVNNAEEMSDALSSATREATSSYNDGRLFIEKFIINPRHIEIQLLADKYGNAVCLGERECSIQRHHQKVIEEAPSPFLDELTRDKMYKQVLALASSVKYFSAGTVEFIADQNKNFYFLEVNTRLQVEHGVTELITGVDIVEEMIKIAAGKKLSFSQNDIKFNGWAIESRIYSEDPKRGFLPSSGRIIAYREPPKSSNIRIDSGVKEGNEVSMFYDAMIAKLCTHAENRDKAIEHMKHALANYVIRGVSHNISFLEAIMNTERFQKGLLSTNFIDNEYPGGFLGAELTSEISRNLLAVGLFIHLAEIKRASNITSQLYGRSQQTGTRWIVKIDDNSYPVFIRPLDGGGYSIRNERNRIYITSNWVLGNILFKGTINGIEASVKIEKFDGGYFLTHAGLTSRVTIRSLRTAELETFLSKFQDTEEEMDILSPITGKIAELKVQEGDEVKANQELLIIEAMKMQNSLYAEHNGRVKKVHIKIGQNISTDQLLLEMEK